MVQAKVLDRQRYNPSLKTGFRGLNSFKRFFVFTASLFFAAAIAGFFGCDNDSNDSSPNPRLSSDTTPPAEVTNLTAQRTTSGEAELFWTNPSDSDFTAVEITWIPAGGETQPKEVGGTAGASGTAEITGLNNYTEYTFTVKAKDTSNNLSGGATVNADFVKIDAKTEPWKLNQSGSYKVTITRAYAICDHELTQGEYETYCKYGDGKQPNDLLGKGDNIPAYNVNWYDAIVYCNLRSKAENLTPCYKLSGESDPTQWPDIVTEGVSPNIKYCGPKAGNTTWDGITCDFAANGYRLPTEAEWEIAARGGLEGDVWAGTDTNANNEVNVYAWYGSSAPKTQEVKQKQPNGYGLYDMSGNIWEWCWDWFDSSAYTGEATDPTGPASSSQNKRGKRSGSWFNGVNLCKVAYRGGSWRHQRDDYIGFRVARSAQ